MYFFESLITGFLRIPLLGLILKRIFSLIARLVTGAMKRADRNKIRPRHWSNVELRYLAPFFAGDVINVSGWRDGDKEGGVYRDYFPKATSYTISNYYGERGLVGVDNEIFLDLESSVPQQYLKKFDVAFNHTVLEHVYEIRKAVSNICALSKDVVILVTPFLQHVHYEKESFGDYWRPTPACLERMLKENGFTTIYQSCNDNEWFIVYVITVATCNPERYYSVVPERRISPDAGVIHFRLE